MTCIAWDSKSLAADRKMTGGQVQNVSKITRLPGGALLAGCGYYDHLVEVGMWLQNGGHEADKPNLSHEDDQSTFLLIEKNAKAYWLTWPWLRSVEIAEPFIAFGSGGDYAMGAMAMGAGAKRAVSIACQLDPNCGKGIDVVRVRPKS